jgi:glycosyltransferase involved in cell wall biosynthesis
MWSDVMQHPVTWFFSIVLGAAWLSRIVAATVHMHSVAEISRPEFDVPPLDPAGQVPRVSIIVPACNEAQHIEQALLSLLQLDYPGYEVIAVNDRSTDQTGAIMERVSADWKQQEGVHSHSLKVLHVKELPPGWLGKTHAMWLAAKHATGKWILFTDADIVFRPDALRRAMVYAERERADHLVLFPTMVMKSIGERMMMAFFQSQFVFAHRPWKVADPKSRDHIGVGAFNLIRGDVYEKLGTYERLRLSVLDDMKLGELVKLNGYRQRNVFGRDLLRLRWIVGVFGMVRNLTKNYFAILRYNPAWTLIAICGMLIINLGPYVGLFIARGWARSGFAVALLSVLAIYLGMSRRSDMSPFYFFLHPIGTLLTVFTVARSMVVTLAQGGVVWRGTWYSLAELTKFTREGPSRSWM